MSDPDVTIAIVPRERFSLTERALANVCEQTTGRFDLVYVSAGAPREVEQYLECEADRRGFKLIQTKQYLSPNQARNLALENISTKYVAFLDNDALVTPPWLDRLVLCAEETEASIVGPLYLIGEFENGIIHMAGGKLHLTEQAGRRIVCTDYKLADVPLDAVREPLRRDSCDFVEFHCMLLRTDFIERLGPLDERLMSLHEHIDVGWVARAAHESVFFEPAAVVTYIVPPPLAWSDLPFFMLRWNDDWASASIAHFCGKWGLTMTRDSSDPDSDVDMEDSVVRWARAHRRLASGLEVPSSWDVGSESALDQARLMVALFQSVDRASFDLTVMTVDAVDVESALSLTAQATFERLPGIMRRAETDRLSVFIRPRQPRRAIDPTLIVADVDQVGLSALQPHGFMTLKLGPQQYQVWLAVDESNWRSATVLRRLLLSTEGVNRSTSFSRLAGSIILEDDFGQPAARARRATLYGGLTGKIITGMQLEDSGAGTHLSSVQVY